MYAISGFNIAAVAALTFWREERPGAGEGGDLKRDYSFWLNPFRVSVTSIFKNIQNMA